MKGLTNYITQSTWSDILTVNYILVDDSYQQIDPALWPEHKFTPFGKPEFSDSEVITIAMFAEMVFHGDEDKTLHFIRQYHLDLFPCLLDAFLRAMVSLVRRTTTRMLLARSLS